MGLFKKAVKEAAKLRMAISGPSGSGKTYTSLLLATELARHGNGKIAVVDTESGSASKYADVFSFDVAEMSNFHPQNYVKAIQEAEAAGYDVVILDSITHAWTGKGGILDIVGGNFAKWKEVNPIEQAFIQAIIASKLHIIATMRAKTQYEVEKDERGRATPKKVGMGAIQRDGIEYEFDIVTMMDLENNLQVEKTRCPAIRGLRVNSPDAKFLEPVISWLNAGAEPAQETEPPAAPTMQKPTPPPADDDNPFSDAPPTNGNGNGAKAEKLPAATLKRLHAVGSEAYGKEWDTKRPELVKSVTKSRSESSSDLTPDEASTLISGMEKRIAKLAAESQAVPA